MQTTIKAFEPVLQGVDIYTSDLGAVIGTNQEALDLDLHLGFRQIAVLRDHWAVGVDTVLLEMRREDCRWIRKTCKMEAA